MTLYHCCAQPHLASAKTTLPSAAGWRGAHAPTLDDGLIFIPNVASVKTNGAPELSESFTEPFGVAYEPLFRPAGATGYLPHGGVDRIDSAADDVHAVGDNLSYMKQRSRSTGPSQGADHIGL